MHEISGYSKLEALDKGKVFLLCLSLSPTTGHKRHILENVGLGEPAPSNQRGEAYNFKAVSTITKRNTERGSYIHALWKTDRRALKRNPGSQTENLSPSLGNSAASAEALSQN